MAATDLIPGGPEPLEGWPHQWFWDGYEHVDPEKEARAQETRLKNNTTTLADEYARRGQDWETQIRQRAKELDLMARLGVPPYPPGPTPYMPTEPAASPDDGPEPDESGAHPQEAD